MEVTKREILVSIIILFFMCGLGLIINNFIIEKHILSVEEYNKSLKINNDKDLFNYSLDTEVGNILAYGTFQAVDVVNLEELKNEFMYIEKVKEKYTKHTRRVCSTDSEGREHCHNEDYYEWDYVSAEENTSNKITFLEKEFNYELFCNYPVNRLSLSENIIDSKKDYVSGNYLYEKKKSFWGASVGDIRYYYNVINKSFNGTIFAKATNKSIVSNKRSKIEINSSDLQSTIEQQKSKGSIITIVFWIIWITLTGLAIYGYMYLDNDYLED